MKKKSNHDYPLPSLPTFYTTVNIPETKAVKRKKLKSLPPSEETVSRLNDLARQTPFCYYYREKENDLL